MTRMRGGREGEGGLRGTVIFVAGSLMWYGDGLEQGLFALAGVRPASLRLLRRSSSLCATSIQEKLKLEGVKLEERFLAVHVGGMKDGGSQIDCRWLADDSIRLRRDDARCNER